MKKFIFFFVLFIFLRSILFCRDKCFYDIYFKVSYDIDLTFDLSMSELIHIYGTDYIKWKVYISSFCCDLTILIYSSDIQSIRERMVDNFTVIIISTMFTLFFPLVLSLFAREYLHIYLCIWAPIPLLYMFHWRQLTRQCNEVFLIISFLISVQGISFWDIECVT